MRQTRDLSLKTQSRLTLLLRYLQLSLLVFPNIRNPNLLTELGKYAVFRAVHYLWQRFDLSWQRLMVCLCLYLVSESRHNSSPCTYTCFSSGASFLSSREMCLISSYMPFSRAFKAAYQTDVRKIDTIKHVSLTRSSRASVSEDSNRVISAMRFSSPLLRGLDLLSSRSWASILSRAR